MTKSKVWFKKKRGSYLPVSWQGWLTYIPFIAYLVSTVIAVNRNTHSASDFLYGIVPQWVAVAVIMTWVAKLKS